MKKNKNLLKAMTLLVIFSIVSCQKDDITEDLVYSSDPSASQRSSHVECVDFETPQLYAGEVVTKLFTNSGLKDVPIFVYGVNPNLSKGTNAAMIFDSSNPSPADADLGSPHRRFGGPGLGAAGAVEPFANKRKLGKILIISDDMNEDNPSDLESTGRIVLDFRSWGMFKLHSLTVIDVEGQNGQPTVELLDANDEVLRALNIPITGNNGVKTEYFDRSIAAVQGAYKMLINFRGSGGLDNICVERVINQYNRQNPTIYDIKNNAGPALTGDQVLFDKVDLDVKAALPITQGSSGVLFDLVDEEVAPSSGPTHGSNGLIDLVYEEEIITNSPVLPGPVFEVNDIGRKAKPDGGGVFTGISSTPSGSVASGGGVLFDINDVDAIASSSLVTQSANQVLFDLVDEEAANSSAPVSQGSNGVLFDLVDEEPTSSSSPVTQSANQVLFDLVDEEATSSSAPVTHGSNNVLIDLVDEEPTSSSSPVTQSANQVLFDFADIEIVTGNSPTIHTSTISGQVKGDEILLRPKGSGSHVCTANCVNHDEYVCVKQSYFWQDQVSLDLSDDKIAASLPISLGKRGAESSMVLLDKSQVHTVLDGKAFGGFENGFAALYREVLTAKLNIANGTDPSSIDKQIGESDLLITRYSWKDWYRMSPLIQEIIFERARMIEAYNKGQLGVLSCD